jgi:predicted N-formylglutamate amidohydrolase
MMNFLDNSIRLIVSCEHGGNDVPQEYKSIFNGSEEVLFSHRGYDPGALDLARFLSDSLKADLYYSTISRLLIEANRSEDNHELYSEFTRDLDEEIRRGIFNKYYKPYREKVSNAILSKPDTRTLHLSVHTFTPVLNGERRKADIGILFDPSRSFESAVSLRMILELSHELPELNILANSPYEGTDDGFTTWLRGRTKQENYAGIEIEVNQKFFTDQVLEFENIKEALVKVIGNITFHKDPHLL